MSERVPYVEFRSASVTEVKFADRVITVLAVPYERETRMVVYKGRQYVESFARGSFTGIEQRSRPVMVNREHVKGQTVGRVQAFYPDAHEGLIEDVKVPPTLLGDETLTLADEGMIFPSVGFSVEKGSDQELDNRSDPPRRYIRRAFQDHLGFVEDPAYDGASVLSMRSAEQAEQDDIVSVSTPRLDEWVQYVASKRVGLTA